MDFKKKALGLGARVLRIAGIILVIYVSMVFYLALTERRNAFPRAITHKEARKAIANTAKGITCTTADGTILEGWAIGNSGDRTLLYYPDADEDAAQFLAEVQSIEGIALIAFNYRGSGNNKGTPSGETFEPDANAIRECATEWGGAPAFVAGRGTGAILAAKNTSKGQTLVLIDPIKSVADAINEKYGVLYPKFLVRADMEIPHNTVGSLFPKPMLLLDRKKFRDRNHAFFNSNPTLDTLERAEQTLAQTLSIIVSKHPSSDTTRIE